VEEGFIVGEFDFDSDTSLEENNKELKRNHVIRMKEARKSMT
jgi:hypothetical protein